MTARLGVTADEDSLAGLSWEWAEQDCPRALTPLAGDFLRALTEGVNAYYRSVGLPMRAECRMVDGYAYSATRLLVPEADLPRVLATMKEMSAPAVSPPAPDAGRRQLVDEAEPAETEPSSSLAAAWDRVWQASQPGAEEAGANFRLKSSLAELMQVCAELWPGKSQADAMKLVQGRPSRLHQVQRDLHRLARCAQSAPAVAQRIADCPDEAVTEMAGLPGGPSFLEELRRFLETHGHIGAPYSDLAAPTWAEQPGRLLSEIQGRLFHDKEDPEMRRQRLEREAEAEAERARADLSRRPQALRRFEEALASAREAAPLLEAQHDRYERASAWPVRRLAVRAGKRLAEAGVIAETADVFFLHADEVPRALRDPRDLRSLVASRRSDHERWTKTRPSRYLGRDARAFAMAAETPAAGGRAEGTLQGTPAGGGRGGGPARIVLSEADFPRVQKGDVLVCPTTAPSWLPLFDEIAGLVTNTGGLLSHAAILAREFGVPAVVGVRDATLRLRDGQWVEVDGSAGAVRVVAD
jgi:phosphohistidine swiveling domain-containing protein